MLDGSLKAIPGYFLLICYLSLFYVKKKMVEVIDTHNFCGLQLCPLKEELSLRITMYFWQVAI